MYFVARPAVRRCLLALYISFLFALTAPLAWSAKPTWTPVAPAELAETAPKLEPAAAAEVIFLRIDVDDRNYPYDRTTTTYVRYKIFDPEKSDKITRVTKVDYEGSDERMELHARLISPDGRIQEFGKEAVKERPLVQQAKQAGFWGWLGSASAAAKERFLAIPGVERGSVLEFHTKVVDRYPSSVSVYSGQREHFPVRRFEYKARIAQHDTFFNRTFFSNLQDAKFTEDAKAGTVSVIGNNLSSWVTEPFSGPITNQVLTIFNTYESTTLYLEPRSGKVPLPGKVEASAGPWAPYATVTNWVARDRGLATKRVTQLAKEITESAQNEKQKAQLIHRWVSNHWQAFREHYRTTEKIKRTENIHSLDDVLDWKKQVTVDFEDDDFLWLAYSLCQLAGLKAHVVMLPDREIAAFNPKAVSRVFLPYAALAIQMEDTWRFSAPHSRYALPFDMLPWEYEGQHGLLALPKKQEFIPIRISGPERSIVGTSGTLTLDEEGTIEGSFVRRLTGQMAVKLRGELRDAPPETRIERAKKKLGIDLSGAELTVLKIDGLEDPEAPLDIGCRLRCEGFAVRTKDRLILRPLVFRADAVTPFPAEERKGPIYFQQCWQEIDQLLITWPEGYALDAPTKPTAAPGEVLHYKVEFGHDDEKRQLFVDRQFMSGVMAVPVTHYASMRKFYDHVVRSDQHELVFTKKKKEARP
ncbi:MAG: hypothetical protein V4773_24160 [Verrucomicrobiota bacterium]